MVKYKRTSERHSQLKNVYLIEDKVTLRYIYRYIPLATLTQSIEFKEPSQWWDEFEKRFYCAEYNQQKYPGYPKKLFALCTTAERDSEAGWKMYKHTEDPLIQIKINRKKFIEALSLYYKNKDVAIYEGKVNYDIKEAHISILHMPSYTKTIKEVEKIYPVKGHDEIFNNFDMDSYLSLLLLKRDAYSYENEIRYFIVPLDEECNNKDIIPIKGKNWLDFVEEIRCSPADKNKVLEVIEGYNNIKLSVFNINKGTYSDDEKIIIN